MNAFQGNSGKISMMRLLSAAIVGTAMLLWVTASIKCLCTGCAWVPLDGQTVALVLGALMCKAGQTFGEKAMMIPMDKTE
jgi:hypothetical protein